MMQQLCCTCHMRRAARVLEENCVDAIDVKNSHLDSRLRDGTSCSKEMSKLDVEIGVNKKEHDLLKIGSIP